MDVVTLDGVVFVFIVVRVIAMMIAGVVVVVRAVVVVVIHAEHLVHRRGYCFHFGCMFVCLYVC